MARKPTFSIVIPTHNYGHFLTTAIDSVLHQGRTDIEILVIDDASSDATESIARAYGEQITYVKMDKNVGPALAWSEGLKRATGLYVCKLDADDWQLPGFMDAVEAGFNQAAEIGVVMTSVFIYTEGGEHAKVEKLIDDQQLLLSSGPLRKRLLREFFMRMPGVAVRRSILSRHAPPMPELSIGHDWEYFLRVFQGHKGLLMGQPLAVYRLHGASVTRTAVHAKRVAEDFNLWLRQSRAPSSANYMSRTDRAILADAMATIYLRIVGFPQPQILFSRSTLQQFLAAYRLAASERLSGTFRLTWFLLLKLGAKIFHFLVRRPPPKELAQSSDLLPDRDLREPGRLDKP
jgi:glycosyltransferase involved in cell wall biosynthesis